MQNKADVQKCVISDQKNGISTQLLFLWERENQGVFLTTAADKSVNFISKLLQSFLHNKFKNLFIQVSLYFLQGWWHSILIINVYLT